MSKFKVGDRVRYLTEGFFGHIGTVVEIKESGLIKVDTHSEYGLCVELDTDLELALAPLIRTVTRKEIVPGVYGKVDVSLYHDGSPCILVSFPKTATEIRESAHTLNQIAEALEDD